MILLPAGSSYRQTSLPPGTGSLLLTPSWGKRGS